MNALAVVAPYKAHGMWVFDDERAGLVQEPFVGGADTILDALTAGIPDAAAGFRLVFSPEAFPGADHRFAWVRPELSGNVYRAVGGSLDGGEGWLCPALLRYFDAPPAELWVQVSPR